MFLAAQISARIGYIDPRTVVGIYLVLVAVMFVAALVVAVSDTANIAATDYESQAESQRLATTHFYSLVYAPVYGLVLFVLLLRWRFVRQNNIDEDWIQSLCIGLLCAPCSLCQMARHTWRYTDLLQGDGLLDGSMVYHHQVLHGAAAAADQDQEKDQEEDKKGGVLKV
jgi:hypothetical protein